MTPEGAVKHACKKVMDARDIWYYMPVQSGYGVGGIPDFICCWKGMFIGIECKAPGRMKMVTPLQRRTIDVIRSHGGRAVVVTSAGELGKWLDLLKELSNARPSGHDAGAVREGGEQLDRQHPGEEHNA